MKAMTLQIECQIVNRKPVITNISIPQAVIDYAQRQEGTEGVDGIIETLVSDWKANNLKLSYEVLSTAETSLEEVVQAEVV